MMRSIVAVGLGVWLALSAWAEPLYFGVVPQQSAIRTATLWGPLVSHLAAETGLEIQLKTSRDIPTFEQELAKGAFHFAYMNPYHFTVFNENPGYQAMAHRDGQGIRGVIVVAKDSDITELGQLDGGVVAFPAPAAFAATLITGAELTAAGVTFIPRYTLSHDSVYRAVSAGLMPAGGGIGRTLAAVDADTRSLLRVLHTTAAYTPHAIAAAPQVDPEVIGRVQRAVTELVDREVLDPLKINAFVAAEDADWNDVRALDLKAIATP